MAWTTLPTIKDILVVLSQNTESLWEKFILSTGVYLGYPRQIQIGENSFIGQGVSQTPKYRLQPCV